ncbi:MAG: hypothetical protein ACI32N_10425 [Bulleidia sp.]
MIRVPLAGNVKGTAWICGGSGPSTLVKERTDCTTFMLKDSLLNETMIQAVESLEAYTEENRTHAKEILLAKDECTKLEKIGFRTVNALVREMTIVEWSSLKITWNMGWTGIYPIRMYGVTDVLYPIVDGKRISGFMVRNRRQVLEGFEHRQTCAMCTQVIDLKPGEPLVPKIIPCRK